MRTLIPDSFCLKRLICCRNCAASVHDEYHRVPEASYIWLMTLISVDTSTNGDWNPWNRLYTVNMVHQFSLPTDWQILDIYWILWDRFAAAVSDLNVWGFMNFSARVRQILMIGKTAQQFDNFFQGHRLLHASQWLVGRVYIEYEPPHDKTNTVSMRSAKTQISLGIHPIWSEFAVRSLAS